MPPDITPQARHPAGVVATENYLPDDPVWVYHEGAWRPGIIVTSSARAATISFRLVDGAATAVDTVPAPYVLARFEPDPLLDRGLAVPAGQSRPRERVPSNYPFWRHIVH